MFSLDLTQPAALAYQAHHFPTIFINCVLCTRHRARSSLMKIIVISPLPFPPAYKIQSDFTSFSRSLGSLGLALQGHHHQYPLIISSSFLSTPALPTLSPNSLLDLLHTYEVEP